MKIRIYDIPTYIKPVFILPLLIYCNKCKYIIFNPCSNKYDCVNYKYWLNNKQNILYDKKQTASDPIKSSQIKQKIKI